MCNRLGPVRVRRSKYLLLLVVVVGLLYEGRVHISSVNATIGGGYGALNNRNGRFLCRSVLLLQHRIQQKLRTDYAGCQGLCRTGNNSLQVVFKF